MSKGKDQGSQRKIVLSTIAILCLGGAVAAFFLLSPEEAGEVKSAAPEQQVAAPAPDPNAALQPKAMSEEEMTAHQTQRRGTTAPEARSKE